MTIIFLVLATAVATAPSTVSPDRAGVPLVPRSATRAQEPSNAGSGRVVVTVSADSLRIPAVRVQLRSIDGGIVVGETHSDAVGQVTFPDVKAGRYVVRTNADGFADTESSPIVVHNGSTEQVLVEMRLTFARQSVD